MKPEIHKDNPSVANAYMTKKEILIFKKVIDLMVSKYKDDQLSNDYLLYSALQKSLNEASITYGLPINYFSQAELFPIAEAVREIAEVIDDPTKKEEHLTYAAELEELGKSLAAPNGTVFTETDILFQVIDFARSIPDTLEAIE